MDISPENGNSVIILIFVSFQTAVTFFLL